MSSAFDMTRRHLSVVVDSVHLYQFGQTTHSNAEIVFVAETIASDSIGYSQYQLLAKRGPDVAELLARC
jgi:hypothetical protein